MAVLGGVFLVCQVMLTIEAYKYKDYAGLHFLRQLRKMTRTDRTDRTEPFISLRAKTGPDRSGPVFEQTA